MPYISIKVYPKDKERKELLVDQINQVFLDTWGCSQEAISISLEEVAPEKWDATVKAQEIEPNADKMMILDGEKKY